MEQITDDSRNYDFNVLDYLNCNYLLKTTDDPEEQNAALQCIGFTQEQSNNGRTTYKFDANGFAKYLLHAIDCVQGGGNALFIYNNNGRYEEAEDWKMAKIIKFLMCQVKDLWSLTRETAALESYKRSVKKQVVVFNETDHLNLQNGMLNVHTLMLLKPSKDFYSTIRLPVVYDPTAQCRRFIQFIDEICAGDNQLQTVMQEMVGYCLSHNSKAEKAFFLYGSGKNGKSVLAQIIQELVGSENVSCIALEALNNQFGIASMVNKMVNISAENELKGKLHTQLFKSIISADTINVTRKYKEDMTCRFSTKLIMLVNNLPTTGDVSYGFFRKIIILPFKVRFEETQDVDLVDKLKQEIPGILNWALVGLKRLQAQKYQFSRCDAIDQIMQDYANNLNPTKEFFDDLYVAQPNGRIKKSEIYSDYQYWASENGVEVVTLPIFWRLLKIKAAEPGSGIDLSKETKNCGIKYLVGYARKGALPARGTVQITF